MNIKLIKFLLALSALLTVIIIAEWWYATRAQKQLLVAIEKTDKQQQTVAQLPVLELTRQPESSFVNLVNRPLFIQGRRPVNEVQPLANKKSNETKVSDSFNWTLNGIYTNKKTLYAFMTRTSGKVAKDNYRKVTRNSEIDGWIVTKIDKDSVVVTQSGGQRKVLPLHKPRPKKTAPANFNQMPAMPPMPNDPAQTPPVPGQMPPVMPPEGIPGAIPEPIPGAPGMPGTAGTAPDASDQLMPELMQEPEPEAIPEPEIIPEEPSDIYLENNENVPLQ